MFEGARLNWDMILWFFLILSVGFVVSYLIDSLKKPILDSNIFLQESIDKNKAYKNWKKVFNLYRKIVFTIWLIAFIICMVLGGYDIERKQNNLGSKIRKEEIDLDKTLKQFEEQAKEQAKNVTPKNLPGQNESDNSKQD